MPDPRPPPFQKKGAMTFTKKRTESGLDHVEYFDESEIPGNIYKWANPQQHAKEEIGFRYVDSFPTSSGRKLRAEKNGMQFFFEDIT